MKTETLSIDLLRLDGDTQARIEVNADTLDEYAELITSGDGQWPFGPLAVYHDGSSYFVADGFHRTLAAINAGRASVPCVVKKGSARDARIYGMTANDQHGLRMSREDRHKNVVWLLDTYPAMSQKDIAEKAGVVLRTVGLAVAAKKIPNAQIAHVGVAKTLDKSSETAADAKSAAKAAKEKAKEEAAEAKAQAKAEAAGAKQKVKDDAAEAKAEAKAAKEAEKLSQLAPDNQAKLNRKLAQSLIDKAVRAVDDLHFVKPNAVARMVAVKLLQEVVLW